jgi:hypothetical protein
MGNHGSKIERDYPTNGPFAGSDKIHGSSAPPNQPPADKKSAEQAVAGLETKTGFRAPTEADQEPLPPVRIFVGRDSRPPTVPEQPKKGDEPKKIHPLSTQPDAEQFMQIDTNLRLRRRAQGSDAHQDAAEHLKQLRKNMHLPEKARPQREILAEIVSLSQNDIDYLKTFGYKRERSRPYAPITLEKMLQDLHQHQEVIRNTQK